MSSHDLEKHPSRDSINKEYSNDAYAVNTPNGGLKRQLKNRHIAMISIAGVIGTGLFLGTAESLKNGGPIGLLLGYIVVGSICYSVMVSLGEMISYFPIAGGYIKLAEMFVNQSFSFVMGWNCWYNWTILLPAELSASAVLINYWNKAISNAVWITMCLIVVLTINMMGAGVYGECEFIFASIKVITITGLIILGIVLDLGGGPSHDRIGFRYWKNPGPFVQYNGIGGIKGQFLGWGAVMTQAAFSYVGTEIVAIAAGETKNPRRNLPKAIRRVYIRILIFYVTGTLIIGLLVPSNDPGLDLKNKDAAASPFVIAIRKAGIKGLPSVINAALLTSAWSAASSDLFTSSRALYGLSISGNAPRIFSRTSKNGLPWVSVLFSSSFSLLAYMSINAGSGRVFGWFANMTAVAGLMTWFGIAFTYLRFYAGLKAQGIDRTTLPYASRLQPFVAWYAVIATVTFCFFSGFTVFLKGGWAVDTFITNYLPFVLFPIMYLVARFLIYKQPIIAPDKMNFKTSSALEAEIEARQYHESTPKKGFQKLWAWLM